MVHDYCYHCLLKKLVFEIDHAVSEIWSVAYANSFWKRTLSPKLSSPQKNIKDLCSHSANSTWLHSLVPFFILLYLTVLELMHLPSPHPHTHHPTVVLINTLSF